MSTCESMKLLSASAGALAASAVPSVQSATPRRRLKLVGKQIAHWQWKFSRRKSLIFDREWVNT